MEDNNQYSDYTVLSGEAGTRPLSKTFMANVFLWMFAALATSSLFAFLFANNATLLSLLINPETGGMTMLGMITMFAPLGFVLLMSFGYNRLSAMAMMVIFLLYATVTGISLSFILLVYTASSVIGCFLSAAAMFGIMAVMGYTTNQDLTSFGRILRMGLIGIIIAMIINFFLGSSQLEYLISIVGVAVFTGLTAYDVQKLKYIGMGIEQDGGVAAVDVKKMAIYGALTLYLDFINLFLFLLRLFGGRRD
ncbi:MAG: Bax inhibitor-1/YccA family protein [Flavipsychrobacter sp.]